MASSLFFPLEIEKTAYKYQKKRIVWGQTKNWPFSFPLFPFLSFFFQLQLIFIGRNLSLRTLIIAFTDTVGFRATILPGLFSPDEQRSVVSACQRQPRKKGASPAGRLFGQIMLNSRFI